MRQLREKRDGVEDVDALAVFGLELQRSTKPPTFSHGIRGWGRLVYETMSVTTQQRKAGRFDGRGRCAYMSIHQNTNTA